MKYNKRLLILTVFILGAQTLMAQGFSPLNPDSSGLTINAVFNQVDINLDPNDTAENGLANAARFFKSFWFGRATLRADNRNSR